MTATCMAEVPAIPSSNLEWRQWGRMMVEDLELRAMPYGEYLQTREWGATRRAAFARADWACQISNSSGRLEVHHRTYERLGDERAADLAVLCDPCHATFHDAGRLVAA